MSVRPAQDPITARWQPVGEILPIYARLLRDGGGDLAVIWAVMTAGVLCVNLVLEAIGLGDLSFFGITPAILPAAFGVGMATHRMLWDNPDNLATCFDIAARAFPSLLAVIAIRQVLVTVGLTLLILPGFIAIVLLFLVPAVVMAERPALQHVFKRSLDLVLPIVWAVAVLILLSALVGLVALIGIAIVSLPLTIISEATAGAFIEAGAVSAAILSLSAMAVAIYRYAAAPNQTRH